MGELPVAEGGCFKGVIMQDFAMVAITALFFALSIGYVYFCERIR